MFKALFAKQLLEVNTFYFIDPKTGKRRSTAGIVGFVLLFLFVFVSCGLAFFGMASLFSASFLPVGLDWLYFAMLSGVAIFLGSFLDMFIASSTLYLAKDNELLLSLPIPPRDILLVRMLGLYGWGALYEAIVFLPICIRYWIDKSFSLSVLLCPLLTFLFSTITVLALSCLLGWVVAALTTRMKNKAILTTLTSLLLIGVWYVCYFRMNALLQSAVANMNKIAKVIGTYLFPLYHLGRGAAGDLSSLLITGALSIALFALVVFILDRTFIRLVTMNRGAKKVAYRQEEAKVSSLGTTLLKKEFSRYFACPAYMLNTGLGVLILPIAGIALFVKRDALRAALAMLPEEFTVFLPLLVAVGTCLGLSIGAFTAPSISLEGKMLWVSQTLPIPAWEIMKAKRNMHLIMNLIPGTVFPVSAGLALGLGWEDILASVLVAFGFSMLTAYVGLIADLKHPNLIWTNETVPVKQSISVLITMLGGWGAALVIGGLGFVLIRYVSFGCNTCMILAFILLVMLSRFAARWLWKNGETMYAGL